MKTQDRYFVAFQGDLLPGTSGPDALTFLQDTFNMPKMRAHALINAGKPVVIKRNLDAAGARLLAELLAAGGLRSRTGSMDDPMAATSPTLQRVVSADQVSRKFDIALNSETPVLDRLFAPVGLVGLMLFLFSVAAIGSVLMGASVDMPMAERISLTALIGLGMFMLAILPGLVGELFQKEGTPNAKWPFAAIILTSAFALATQADTLIGMENIASGTVKDVLMATVGNPNLQDAVLTLHTRGLEYLVNLMR
ncbi:MAG: hypothetical protein ACPGUC_07875 [Gammaproteobacteria bacterium]